ncbi:hypothetical protein [Methylorubrum extorquens]|uniref:hypothetical protein n=1 Tax=Methylorubrum extorquens TaxID=408 RepID=UPI001300FB63|nr:hypothetical protein [Methylorubrum extorquens]
MSDRPIFGETDEHIGSLITPGLPPISQLIAHHAESRQARFTLAVEIPKCMAAAAMVAPFSSRHAATERSSIAFFSPSV